MKAKLILENGVVFEGNAFGHIREAVGEVVFNTGMTGYEEVLTDPSYYGQIVTMTYPLIGNYGINLEDMESDGAKVKGFIVREKANTPSNFRCEFELDTYLKKNRIIGLEGIDTRALTKMIREQGTMKGIITLRELSKEQINQNLKSFHNRRAVMHVSTKEIIEYDAEGEAKYHIGVMDFGTKQNIVRELRKRGCKITVFPYDTKSEDILKENLDGLFLSNGPGDPKDLVGVIEEIGKVVGKLPIGAICLGHQLLALALNGDTTKLKFGHRGVNHPVKDLGTGRVLITSQNHGYVVTKEGIPEGFEVTHINLNDQTVEGMKHEALKIMSVQFHPEACPGPYDAVSIFDTFVELYEKA